MRMLLREACTVILDNTNHPQHNILARQTISSVYPTVPLALYYMCMGFIIQPTSDGDSPSYMTD